jgi:hypothetical protein
MWWQKAIMIGYAVFCVVGFVEFALYAAERTCDLNLSTRADTYLALISSAAFAGVVLLAGYGLTLLIY